MERFITKELIEWKDDPKRKPLILRGMRQCGKTWVLKEFGKKYFQNLVYVSFDEHSDYKDFFSSSKDPLRIIGNLSVALQQPIIPGETLIVFDEIQDCPDALGALKYFAENAPQYHVACAGSLLGIRIAGGGSFPVGKVDFLSLYPMSFSEFLIANGDENLYEYQESVDRIEPIPATFSNLLHERLKLYFITGGMPEAVVEWIDRRDTEKLDRTQSAILASYNIDFAKHLSSSLFQKVALVWNSLPAQLAKENKKFQYNIIKDHASARDYGEAIAWLSDANLVHRVGRIKAPGLPISAYDDPSSFKLYAADIGLLRGLSHLDAGAFGEGNRLFTEFKGALTENFILQSLSRFCKTPLRYWTTYNPTYEVDFILQKSNDIVPIEVKSGLGNSGKGLAVYRQKYPDKVRLRVRYSLLGLNLTDDLLNIPLFMVDQTDRLIEIAMHTMAEIQQQNKCAKQARIL